MNRRKHLVVAIFVLLCVLTCLPVWATERQTRQQKLDQDLIKAIQERNDKAALAALEAGASGEAMGMYTPPIEEPFEQRMDRQMVDRLKDLIRSLEKIRDQNRSPDVISDKDYRIREFKEALQDYEQRLAEVPPIKPPTPIHMPALLLLLHNPYEAKDNWQIPNAALVRALLNHGAYVNDRDEKGRTSLFYAVHTSPEITRLLLDRGATVNVKDKDQQTPLMFADIEQAKLLLKQGAKINAVNKDHWTALMGAAFTTDTAKARILLEHRADVSVKDLDGRTALDLTKEIIKDLAIPPDTLNEPDSARRLHDLQKAVGEVDARANRAHQIEILLRKYGAQ